MPRRYRRNPDFVMGSADVPLARFPDGEGAMVFLKISDGSWPRLGPGQGALVGGEDGHRGALAFGVMETVAIIWAYLAPRRPFRAYCYHLGQPSMIPVVHRQALRRLGVGLRDLQHTYVVMASQREIDDEEAAFFIEEGGIRSDRILLYSGSLLAQFGVSAAGCVGEAG